MRACVRIVDLYGYSRARHCLQFFSFFKRCHYAMGRISSRTCLYFFPGCDKTLWKRVGEKVEVKVIGVYREALLRFI